MIRSSLFYHLFKKLTSLVFNVIPRPIDMQAAEMKPGCAHITKYLQPTIAYTNYLLYIGNRT